MRLLRGRANILSYLSTNIGQFRRSSLFDLCEAQKANETCLIMYDLSEVEWLFSYHFTTNIRPLRGQFRRSQTFAANKNAAFRSRLRRSQTFVANKSRNSLFDFGEVTPFIKFILFIGVFLIHFISFAQKEVSLCEVPVKGIRPERFMIGQKVQDVDSANLARNSFSTMADFLQFQTPIAFKSYGAGQTTTISFRGTSPNHTALLWNGVNINFPSLGLSDFSTIPLAGFDQMTIQYGSAASCVGSDAVGGSIHLRSTPQFKQAGLQTLVAVKAESSENYSGQVGLRFNKNWKHDLKFSSKTLLYLNQFNNNFGTEPISNKKGRSYLVEPAHNTQKGLVQDLYLMQKNGNLFSVNIWLTDNNLIVQPQNIDFREITRTQAIRTISAYQWGKTLLRAGFIRDITDYGKGENLNPRHTEIDRYIVRIEHDFSWIKSCEQGTNLKIGAELVHYIARVDDYNLGVQKENRHDYYALLRHQFNGRLSASLNLRQAFVTKYNPPFTPSAGVEYVLIKRAKTKITLPANIALSYRVPTLNERYWVKLGNPDIRPEKGFNKEIGILWQQKLSEQTQTKFSITAFHNLIDNWTYWNPDNNYRVENLQQVLSKGLEFEFGLKTKIQEIDLSTNMQYGLTNASQQKEFGAYSQDILGKQLIYVPRHTISNTTSATYKKLNMSIQQSYNSARYITFDHSGLPFPPYYLMNCLLNYQKKWAVNQLDMILQVNNLTNTLYPNIKKNAMPMRSVALSFVLHFL